MNEIAPAYSKSVGPQVFNRYRFFGYTFDVPINVEVHGIEIQNRAYCITTDTGSITLKACHKCKRLLEKSCFYERKSPCKQCHILLVKSWQKRNPDAVKIHKRQCNKAYRYKQKLKAVGLI